MTTMKTEEELLQEIEMLQGEVNKLKRFEKYVDLADEMGVIREAFESSGFSHEESMQMLLSVINMAGNCMKPTLF